MRPLLVSAMKEWWGSPPTLLGSRMTNKQRPGLAAHRRIAVWNFAVDLVVDVYRLTRGFPREEAFVLSSQLRRAAISIPSNVAEGNQRRTIADRRRFITDAQGSLAEIETQLEIASRLGYLGDGDFMATLERTDHIGRMLTNMYRNMTARP
jgi:four helix bundle protein